MVFARIGAVLPLVYPEVQLEIVAADRKSTRSKAATTPSDDCKELSLRACHRLHGLERGE
jgi:hypothetical protein